MARFDPLNPDAPIDSEPESRKRAKKSARAASHKRGTVPQKARGQRAEGSLQTTVGAIPLATFACLLGNADISAATDARDKFVTFCQDKTGDWRAIWKQFLAAQQTGCSNSASPARTALIEKSHRMKQYHPLTKAFPNNLRRVLRRHPGHLEAFEKAIAGLGEYEARFEQECEPHGHIYLPLVIEVLQYSPAEGCRAVSVAHYGKQNGDAMRDPEIVFAVVSPEAWLPYEITQDYVGQYHCAFDNAGLFSPRVSQSMIELSNIFGRNINGQG
jgi:hypothetical protein